nr:hypothetical protein [Scytonema sp. HK-05]
MLNIKDFNNRFRQYNVIIVRKETVLLGLVVPARKGTNRLSTDTRKSPSSQVLLSLFPYLGGCVC